MKTFEEVIAEYVQTPEETDHIDDLLDSSEDAIVEIHCLRFKNKISLVPRVPDNIDEEWHLGDKVLYIIRRNEEVFWIEFVSSKKQEVKQLEALWSR